MEYMMKLFILQQPFQYFDLKTFFSRKKHRLKMFTDNTVAYSLIYIYSLAKVCLQCSSLKTS